MEKKTFKFTTDSGSGLLFYGDEFVAKFSVPHKNALKYILEELTTANNRIKELEATNKRWAEDYAEVTAGENEFIDLQSKLTEVTKQLSDIKEIYDQFAPDEQKPLLQRVKDEWHDFRMIIRHCATIYCHFSGGRISKPNTLPDEVIAVANDLESERVNEAVKEENETLSRQAASMREALGWLEEHIRVNLEGGGVHHCPWCYKRKEDDSKNGADWKDIQHSSDCMIGAALFSDAGNGFVRREVLENLVNKLVEVHADPRYESVWKNYVIHGHLYEGPFYANELKAAQQALKQ